MEVKYLNRAEFEQWNEFVNGSPQGFIFDYSWWVDILTKGDFKICALFDDDSIIVAGLVLPFFSTGKIKTPILTQSMGFLFEDFSKQNNIRLQKQVTKQKEYSGMIWDYIEKDIKNYLNIQFNYHYDYWSPLYWKGCEQTTKYTYIIDYSDYIPEEEFKRFSKGHKWILNKVEKKSDLKVVETEDVDEYLKESIKTYQRQGSTRLYSDELVKALYTELKSRGMAKIFKCVDNNNRIHGITFFIYDHREVYYWLGASDAELRESGGHTYLVWYAIKYFSDKVRFFNFGGSMIEAVEKNFKNFSSLPKPYYIISYYKHPIIAQLKKITASILKMK